VSVEERAMPFPQAQVSAGVISLESEIQSAQQVLYRLIGPG
jgi:hypothetical protein